MSSQDAPFRLLEDALREIEDEQNTLKNAILGEAIHLASKDGHTLIDKTYIRKASKRIKTSSSSSEIWAVRVFLLLMIPLIVSQISGLRTPEVSALPLGLHISLWLLPIFSIALIVILSYALRDLILP